MARTPRVTKTTNAVVLGKIEQAQKAVETAIETFEKKFEAFQVEEEKFNNLKAAFEVEIEEAKANEKIRKESIDRELDLYKEDTTRLIDRTFKEATLQLIENKAAEYKRVLVGSEKYQMLLDLEENFKDTLSSEVKKQVAIASNQIKNAVEKEDADLKQSLKTENITLAQQNQAYQTQVNDLKETVGKLYAQLDSERAAGIQRAAGAAPVFNVNDKK